MHILIWKLKYPKMRDPHSPVCTLHLEPGGKFLDFVGGWHKDFASDMYGSFITSGFSHAFLLVTMAPFLLSEITGLIIFKKSITCLPANNYHSSSTNSMQKWHRSKGWIHFFMHNTATSISGLIANGADHIQFKAILDCSGNIISTRVWSYSLCVILQQIQGLYNVRIGPESCMLPSPTIFLFWNSWRNNTYTYTSLLV